MISGPSRCWRTRVSRRVEGDGDDEGEPAERHFRRRASLDAEDLRRTGDDGKSRQPPHVVGPIRTGADGRRDSLRRKSVGIVGRQRGTRRPGRLAVARRERGEGGELAGGVHAHDRVRARVHDENTRRCREDSERIAVDATQSGFTVTSWVPRSATNSHWASVVGTRAGRGTSAVGKTRTRRPKPASWDTAHSAEGRVEPIRRRAAVSCRTARARPDGYMRGVRGEADTRARSAPFSRAALGCCLARRRAAAGTAASRTCRYPGRALLRGA